MREIPYNHEKGAIPASLRKIDFLSHMDDSALDEILGHSSILECSAGETIFREGDVSKEFYILLKGTVQITKAGKPVAVVKAAGELLGELSSLRQQERSASVTAAGHAFLLKVDPDFLNDLSANQRTAYYAVLYRFLAKVLAERLAETSARVAELEKELYR